MRSSQGQKIEYLEKRQGSNVWRVRVPISKPLQSYFGGKFSLTQSTGSSDTITREGIEYPGKKARDAALPIIADFKRKLDEAEAAVAKGETAPPPAAQQPDLWRSFEVFDPNSKQTFTLFMAIDQQLPVGLNLADLQVRRQGGAQQIETSLVALQTLGEPLTLDAFMEGWLIEQRRDGKQENPNTYRDYRNRVRDLLDFAKVTDPRQITTHKPFTDYRLYLRRPVDEGGKGIDSKRADTIMGIYSSCYAAAKKHGIITVNPMLGFERDRFDKGGKGKAYEVEQINAILTEAISQKLPPEIMFPLLIGITTGPRIGEVLDCPTVDGLKVIEGVKCIVFRPENRPKGLWLKVEYSERDTPLARLVLETPAWLPDGQPIYYEQFVAQKQASGERALFSEFKAYANGSRKETGGKIIRAWIRSTGVIPEALEGTNAAEGGRKIKPYHSFRNTVQTWWENNTEIAEKTRNAVTGHKTEGIVGRYIEVKKARMLEAIEMLPFKPVDDELVEAA